MRKTSAEVATIILAGGQGTRLYPLTLHHSKPAVVYGGRYRLIDIPISNSINSGFRQIFVIAQYLSAELQHHISQTYRFDMYNPGSIEVLTPQMDEKGAQEWFQGTADAVRKNLPTLLKSNAKYFLILSGDQLYNINFQQMVSFAQTQGADLTIGATTVLEEEAKRMGLLKIDRRYRVIDFIEKPKGKKALAPFKLAPDFYKQKRKKIGNQPSFLGSMGIYVFERKTLISLLKQDQREDFGYHLIATALKTKKISAFLYHKYWEDIGTVASYYDANLILTHSSEGLDTYDEHNPIYTRPTFLPGPKIKKTKIIQSIICEGCVIEAEEINHCVIGLRSQIKRGTILRDTVMLGNHFYMPPTQEKKAIEEEYWVGEDCLIEKTIIDEHVQIGNRVKLINQKKLLFYDGKGIFVRDGIIIVTAGTKIPDDFEF